MRASHCKRSAVLGTTLIAATLALSPVGLQQASAATPSGTHTSATTTVQRDNSYRQGFKAGYRAGWADAKDDCRMSRNNNNNFNRSNNSYANGYDDGYSAGYSRAEDRYC
ncbi:MULTISPECIES: hypothetical protein [Streptomyces]|uniref:Uncharacterized protein n=2 Tax=Streptomyces TaxID=1883 RepID=A0A101QMD7_STRCK|nr:hypothetical protein [Streptomyces corchorusii]AEY89206.1 hypothetical protein SHJG_3934 [Streptomyces hygroscopicus subsp. jinggangensis 5008]AGF63364.1 hypothetical protein SHJGH_3699 [Streptomyces hygroscopicus subsp. jinggangensis TL01]KUN32585.1 hypothetical protein AQJ11_03405 [Streptomyces corchorusii]